MRNLFTFTTPLSRYVNDEGFSHGSQDNPADDALLQIDAEFNERKAKIVRDSSHVRKSLEADIEHLGKILPEVESRWEAVKARLGEEPPPAVFAAVLLLISILAVAAEAVMLAPSLDFFGIANPTAQLVFASSLGAVSTVALHYFLESLEGKFSPAMRWFIRIAALGLIIGLVFFGLVRGEQSAVAAQLSDNPIYQFFSAHPLLVGIVFIFVTIAFPVTAALASTHAVHTMQDFYRFKRAQQEHRAVPMRLFQAKKQLQAEEESLVAQQNEVDESRKKARHDFLVHHALGQQIGAKQMPLWMVWLKAALAALIALLVSFAHPLCPLIVAIVFIAAWIYYYRVRVHPTPSQIRAHANIGFRPRDGAPVRVVSGEGESQ